MGLGFTIWLPAVQIGEEFTSLLKKGLLDRSKGVYKKSIDTNLVEGLREEVCIAKKTNQLSSEDESDSMFSEYDSKPLLIYVNVIFLFSHYVKVVWLSDNLEIWPRWGMFAYYYFSPTFASCEDLSITKYVNNAIFLARESIFWLDVIFWNKGYCSISF